MALGRCLLWDCRVSVRFSTVVYKALLNLPVSLIYLKVVDSELCRSLEWIKSNDVDDLDITFSYDIDEFGLINTIPLQPGGGRISVTNANKDSFVTLRCAAALSAMIEKPLEELRTGFEAIVPLRCRKDLSVTDLQLALCGSISFSVSEWRRYTRLTPELLQHPKIEGWFWDIVNEMSSHHRLQLLFFATAMAALPPGGFVNLHPPFTLGAMLFGPVEALPVSHACFHTLELPVWQSYETLRTKILLAITETEGFGLV